jgi:hypothetical protein
MTISNAIGLLAALIGSTATLLGAWAYLRAQRLPKRELFRVASTITAIMVCILGIAVFMSQATTIKIKGQETIPLPLVPTKVVPTPDSPRPAYPITSPTLTSTPKPAHTLTPTSTTLPTSALTPTVTPSPSPTSIQTSTVTPFPSPTSSP